MILVTGDVVLDHNIYVGQRFTPASEVAIGTRHRREPGGAILTFGLLNEMAANGHSANANGGRITSGNVAFGLSNVTVDALDKWPPEFHSGALWEPFPSHDGRNLHWGLSRSLGYGRRTKPAYPASPAADLEKCKCCLVVIDDAGLGFRLRPAAGCWPPFLRGSAAPEQLRWVILKMSRPLAQGDLWWELASRWREKLIVVVSADDLRQEPVRVSKGLSWEGTVEDVLKEVESNPALHGLQSCRNLIVTLRGDGAIWLENPGKVEQERCRLVFDRERGEGEHASSRDDGGAYGSMSVVTAALASYLWKSTLEQPCDLAIALKSGLSATRFLAEFGHGAVSGDEPGFPFREAAEHLMHPTNSYAVADVNPAGRYDVSESTLARPQWTILSQAFRSQAFPGPLFGPARRLALLGPTALEGVPCARFGKLLTMDRREIESLRALRHLMLSYRDGGPRKQPLSLAVFGAPGSGKSFGLKQIAEAVFGEKNPVLEFNLSQFRGPEDLIGAYHLVRDHVLAGKTPVVFWDEFDSRKYFWLQYFLAPMQDGVFQEGQQSHATGKSVFVFAGGTSRDFAHFGPVADPNENEPEAQKRARHDFLMAKGPDFRSRLAAFLDVVGPNPRQTYDMKSAEKDLDPWKDDSDDIDFPVRRAILLRSLLGLIGEKESQPLKIDLGLLTALLGITHYRNGARSMEKLIAQMRDRGGTYLRRADLPPEHLLALYVDDVRVFDDLIRSSNVFLAQAERIAPILHQDYRDGLPAHEKGGHYDVPYDALDEEGKAANVAAATRIAEILALAGFTLAVGQATPDQEAKIRDFLENNKEFLAAAEHEGWMDQRRMEGWTYAPVRDNAAREHPLLVPYAELPEEQKEKDRRTILNYPKYARAAGFKIVSQK